MKVPTLEKIQEWRKSGKMRRTDEIFWEGDRKLYDFWLYCVEDRVKKWQKNKE
jgi:hypothetical protein